MSVYRSSVLAVRKAIRRLRFAVLEAVVLPLGVLLYRALMWTWRVQPVSPTLLDEIACEPRLIFTVFHGTLVEALAQRRMWKPFGRGWLILTTPSLDGRLAAAMLERLEVGYAPLRAGERGIGAAREYLARVGAGEVGVLLVDGPRGPRGIVKPGVPRTINAAAARVVAVGFACSRGLRLGSWDRTAVPAPFARVHVHCALVPLPEAGRGYDVVLLQAAMDAVQLEAARSIAAAPVSPHRPIASARDEANPVHPPVSP